MAALFRSCRPSAFQYASFSGAPRASIVHSPRCTTSNDLKWMRVALGEARLASHRSEVPVGAVIVTADGEELSRAGNAVETLNNATMHAEMRVIQAASGKLGVWRLLGTTLYCSLEPCAMCLSAAALARVSRIVYGARDLRLGACGTWTNLANAQHPYHQFDEVIGGVLGEESANLMKEFFKKRRLENKNRRH